MVLVLVPVRASRLAQLLLAIWLAQLLEVLGMATLAIRPAQLLEILVRKAQVMEALASAHVPVPELLLEMVLEDDFEEALTPTMLLTTTCPTSPIRATRRPRRRPGSGAVANHGGPGDFEEALKVLVTKFVEVLGMKAAMQVPAMRQRKCWTR